MTNPTEALRRLLAGCEPVSWTKISGEPYWTFVPTKLVAEARKALAQDPEPRYEQLVTRCEVIDHRHGAPSVGRVFVAWGARVSLSYQDAGRTLKVFVDDHPGTTGLQARPSGRETT